MYAICVPSGDRSARLYDEWLFGVMRCLLPPSMSTDPIPPSQSPPSQLTNKMCCPSGVNLGQRSSDRLASGVSWCGFEPSASAIQIAKSPLRELAYAIFVPSGD